MKPVRIGATQRQIFPTGSADSAAAVGNHGVDVVATTVLVLFCEELANHMILPYFDEGDLAVGTRVCMDHLAPAVAGLPVAVTATLTRQDGRRLEFALRVHQQDTLIMEGTHHRAIVRQEKFSSSAEPSADPSATLDFWFDFHSPWCYFASHRIGAIAARLNRSVNWKPVHLANLINAMGGRQPLEESRQFVKWYKQDQRDHAVLYGLPFATHKAYPKRPSRALRAAIHAAESGLAEPFVKRVMSGYWSQQKDISDMDWVASVAIDTGLDAQAAREAMTADAYRQALNDNLQEALALGLFGLPTTVLDRKLYFGNDRLDLMLLQAGVAPRPNPGE